MRLDCDCWRVLTQLIDAESRPLSLHLIHAVLTMNGATGWSTGGELAFYRANETDVFCLLNGNSIETTTLPTVPEVMEQVARQGKAAAIDVVTDAVIEPSTPSYEDYDPEDTGGDGAEYDPDEATNPEDRIGIKHFFKHYLKNKFKHHLVTVIKTVTVTDTYTSYVTTTASTKTFFIQKCTPTPFTFSLCTKTNWWPTALDHLRDIPFNRLLTRQQKTFAEGISCLPKS